MDATGGPPQGGLIGTVLDGRYKIEAALGEGGMGLVYKAVHTTLQKPLAIKVLKPEVSKNDEIVARFKQEARSASAIGNQHIIDISDFGVAPDGSTYFVMEFLTGCSLTDALETEVEADKLTVERTIHIAKQLCKALGAAHESGIVHRDMKPDNVQLIDRGGDRDFVKVLDFGIAKVGGSTSKLTQAGQVFGTPHYMSPEQCAGTAVDHRTDIYAVGVMLYEMATGQVPFDADNLMGILTKHLYENPVPPHELPPPVDVPPSLEAVILKCLAKKPEHRYQSMVELLEDLEAVERGLTPQAVVDQVDRGPAAPGTVAPEPEPTGRVTVGVGGDEVPGRRRWVPVAVVGLILVGAGVGIAMSMDDGGSDAGAGPATAGHVVEPESPPNPSADPSSDPGAEPQPATAEAEPQPEAEPEPEPPPQVTIRSQPEGAELYRDGALLENTPATLIKPEEGETIELELRKSGYRNKTFSITSLTGDDLTVSLDRKKVRKTYRKPKKPAGSRTAPTPPKKPKQRPQTEVLDPWD
jgi:serine/threonine-protein kinase